MLKSSLALRDLLDNNTFGKGEGGEVQYGGKDLNVGREEGLTLARGGSSWLRVNYSLSDPLNVTKSVQSRTNELHTMHTILTVRYNLRFYAKTTL
jgi:hypothetical protein